MLRSVPADELPDLTIWRDGEEHYMRFSHGDAVAPLKVVGKAEGKKGTRVTFLPSPATFKITEFDFDMPFISGVVDSAMQSRKEGTG